MGFNDPARRTEAEKILDEQQPQLLIGSPMCTAFPNIQNLNKAKRDPAVVPAEIEKARVHLNWCCRLYQKQTDRGDISPMSIFDQPPHGADPTLKMFSSGKESAKPSRTNAN